MQVFASVVQVEGLLGLFGQRLGRHAPRAAAAVAAVASDMSLGSMASTAAGQPPDAYARSVTLSERRTCRIPPPVALGEWHRLSWPAEGLAMYPCWLAGAAASVLAGVLSRAACAGKQEESGIAVYDTGSSSFEACGGCGCAWCR